MLSIFGVPISAHARKAIVTANLKGIAYHNEPVIPFDPPEGWTSLSPTGLIPAIRHDGFELADSAAICAYLERLEPAPSIYPTDAHNFARALWLEQYGGVLFRSVVHPLFHQNIIRPYILKQGDPDQAEIGRVVGQVVPAVFGYLEGQVAGGFLMAGGLTIADITIASNLLNYHYLGFRIAPEQHPRLGAAFVDTIGHRAVRAALDAEAPFAERMGLDRSIVETA